MSRIFPSSSETKAKTFFEHYYVIKNEFVRLLKIQPNSGHFGLDLFYLFIIALIQTTVLPNISGGFSGFDLLTPWLIVSCVFQPFTRSVILLLFTSLYLETFSSTPAGLYVTLYWVLATLTVSFRSSISWRNTLPWLSIFLISELIIVSFEVFTAYMLGEAIPTDLRYIFTLITRLVSAISFGLLLVHYQHKKVLREEELA